MLRECVGEVQGLNLGSGEMCKIEGLVEVTRGCM